MSTEPIDVEAVEVTDDGPGAEVVTLPDRYEWDADQAAVVEQMGPVAADEFKALAAQALVLSRASAVPGALRGKPHDVLLVLMSARDLGLAPTVAMRKMYVVDGQVTIAPALKMALVRMKGLGRVWFDPANNAEEATCYGQRVGEDHVHAVTFTMEDAKRAGLEKKNNWKAYPGRMLQWRAVGYLVDDVFPEVSFGMYSPDELGAYTDDDGHVIDVDAIDVPEGYESKSRRRGRPSDVAVALQARYKALPVDYRTRFDAWTAEHSDDGKPVQPEDMGDAWWAKVDAVLSKAEAQIKADPPVACLSCNSTADPCECAPDGAQDDHAADEANLAQRVEEAHAEALADDAGDYF